MMGRTVAHDHEPRQENLTTLERAKLRDYARRNALHVAAFNAVLTALGVVEDVPRRMLAALWVATEGGRNCKVNLDNIAKAAGYCLSTVEHNLPAVLAALPWPLMRRAERGGKYRGANVYDMALAVEVVGRVLASGPVSARACQPIARRVLLEMGAPVVPLDAAAEVRGSDGRAASTARRPKLTPAERLAAVAEEHGTATVARRLRDAFGPMLAELLADLVREAEESGDLARAAELATADPLDAWGDGDVYDDDPDEHPAVEALDGECCGHEDSETYTVVSGEPGSSSLPVNPQLLRVDPDPEAPAVEAPGPRMVPVELRPANVPDELRAARAWLCWRFEPRPGGKPAKRPLRACDGRPADVTRPEDWASLAEALDGMARYGAAGVGLCLDGLPGVACVDLDGVRDPRSGELTPEARAIADRLNTFTEVSPSGTGVHVWCRGAIPSRGRRRGNVEVYSSARFIAVTGVSLSGTPGEVLERGPELAQLVGELFPEGSERPARRDDGATDAPAPATPVSVSPTLSDDELVRLALAAPNGARLDALLAGHWRGYPSPSEADLAAARLLAFWTSDAAQVRRIMERSGLARPKWRTHPTYLERTIARAMASRTASYGGGRHAR